MKRFWDKVDTSGDCWEWTAYRDTSGYGYFKIVGQSPEGAHRVAWRLARGDIPAGLEIDHLCRNRGCVNPEHLEPVTRQENMFRARRETCMKGHKFDAIVKRSNRPDERRCSICHAARAREASRRKRDKSRRSG